MCSKWILLIALMITSSVRGQLTSEAVSEGPCDSNIEKYVAKNVDYTQLGMTKDYYVPMGSQAMYRHYGEALLGRSLASYAELSEMQLRIKITMGKMVSNRAFPKRINSPYFSQKCDPNNVGPKIPQVLCKPICGSGSSSANLKDPAVKQILNTLVYWHSPKNEITFLVVMCPSDGIQDYKVLSTNKTIWEPTKTKILNKIKEIGFDTTLLYYMQYD